MTPEDQQKIAGVVAALREIYYREIENELIWRAHGAPPSCLVGGIEDALHGLRHLIPPSSAWAFRIVARALREATR